MECELNEMKYHYGILRTWLTLLIPVATTWINCEVWREIDDAVSNVHI